MCDLSGLSMPHAHKRRGGGHTTTANSTMNVESIPTPPPFSPAPSSLDAFLQTLPKSHVYLTSLDTHPKSFKRRLFAVPLLLNIFISAMLLYRFQRALPIYIDLFLTIFGYQTSQTVDVKNSDLGTLLYVGGERMMLFMGDFVLVRFVGMWPWDFFIGRGGKGALGNPVGWRRWVYFRDTEIIVRRSRRWDRSLFSTPEEKAAVGAEVSDDFLEQKRSSKVFQERVEPAIAEEWVRTKTGYVMMDKSWDLYFSAMVDAHELVDNEALTLDDFKTQVLVYSEKYGGWLIWQVWKEHEARDGPLNTSKLMEADQLK